MPPDTVVSGYWALPLDFHVVTLICYYNFLVWCCTVDMFDYHIKLILHKNRYQMFCFYFVQFLRQFSIHHSQICWRRTGCNLWMKWLSYNYTTALS